LQNLSFGRSTRKDKTVYLHVFDWPADGKLQVEGLTAGVASVRLLAGRQQLTFHKHGDQLEIETPRPAPDANDTVLALETR
jgi:alpha-L-fucosidase